MRNAINRLLIAASIFLLAHIAHAGDRELDALAGLVKTDDGTYKTVVLLPGQEPAANFCDQDWSYGFVREGAPDPIRTGKKISLPGCWGGIGNSANRNFEFRYMTPAKVGLYSFTINIDELKRLKYDTETDELVSAF
ncbi:hypothetical protein [Pseudomonas nitroreducens]|uniref:hypothetical protein n=1 Tax=Pseudomonas nitroreducens TaxID=46680 RepID=UPI003CC836D0